MKKLLVCLLCLLCLVCGGCGGAKEESAATGAGLIGADAGALPVNREQYVLYFRLGNTDWLVPEVREMALGRNEMTEAALVEALIAGPAATSAALSPLFPQGTQVLATARQGQTLFITLNEKFLSGYGAERADLSGEEKKLAVQKERQLCLDALAATLTEAGLCSNVQLLVYRTSNPGASLRLEEDYLYLNGSAMPLPPAERREDTLYTPHNAAGRLMTAWMNRSWTELTDCLTAMPPEQTALESLAQAPVLTGFSLSPGVVSPDGQAAVVTAQVHCYQDGNAWSFTGYPLRLQREGGVWKMQYDALMGMMEKD